ncbi:Genetic interactor of prohibitin 5 mitochondrial [Bienertia sinuspersici]
MSMVSQPHLFGDKGFEEEKTTIDLVLNQKKMNRGKRKLPQKMEGPNADGQEEIVKISGGQSTRKQQVLKRKKQKK